MTVVAASAYAIQTKERELAAIRAQIAREREISAVYRGREQAAVVASGAPLAGSPTDAAAASAAADISPTRAPPDSLPAPAPAATRADAEERGEGEEERERVAAVAVSAAGGGGG